jgi:hypothetical protein
MWIWKNYMICWTFQTKDLPKKYSNANANAKNESCTLNNYQFWWWSKIGLHLPNRAQILPISIHTNNQYPASPYHHPSICPYDDNWWLWGGHLAHLVCAGLDLWLVCLGKLKNELVVKNWLVFAQLPSPNPAGLYPQCESISISSSLYISMLFTPYSSHAIAASTWAILLINYAILFCSIHQIIKIKYY